MNRRKFALSWGRKLFFGLSWPLTLLLSLVYLRSSILPETNLDWIFVVSSYIGYFGLLNALAYFVIFVPVVALMPSYYVSRFLSLILILALNLFVIMDALTFANYHQHIYGFLSELIIEEGIQNFVGSTGLILIGVAVAIFGLLIWIRGEMIWRNMQTRFSNPNKNWYLVMIVLLLVVAKAAFYYGELHPKLATIFPFDKNLQKSETIAHPDNRKFYYPADELNCSAKTNPNIILITIKEWSADQFNADSMPSLFHMKRHALSYNSNYAASTDAEGGMFSLMYSVPASYQSAVKGKSPAIMTELNKRKYDIQEFTAGSDDETMSRFRQWIESNTGEEIAPRFLSFNFRQHSSDVDKLIQEIILTLQKEDILSGAHIVITGGYAGQNGMLIPLIYVQPDRKSADYNHVTSQYDVMPTLMQKAWNCKNAFRVASVGESLDQTKREWLLMTGPSEFRIVDFVNNNVTTVASDHISDASVGPDLKPARHELIFSALKMMASFSKFK